MRFHITIHIKKCVHIRKITNCRFQKHLEKVRDTVKSAFAALPDKMDSDFLTSTLEMENCNENSTKNSRAFLKTECHPIDNFMCELVDVQCYHLSF